MKDVKAIFMVALCLIVAFLGLYFQFFSGQSHKDTQENRQENRQDEIQEEKEKKPENGTEPAEKPAKEEELTPERFGVEDGCSVYFTEMEEIQEDDAFLPYQAYADLVPATMEFLKTQKELPLPENRDLELRLREGMARREENRIGFHCYFADLETDLEIEYIYDDIEMDYTEIRFTEKGIWGLEWKK